MNNGVRAGNRNFGIAQDMNKVNFRFREEIFAPKEAKGRKPCDLGTIEVANCTIKPQIGDEVIAEGAIEGITGTIRGAIIAEVELYDCYQIKLSEFNAIYVPKYKVRVVKRKSDIEREEKIKKLKEDIHSVKSEKDTMEIILNSLECKLDNLYKELEKLEG